MMSQSIAPSANWTRILRGGEISPDPVPVVTASTFGITHLMNKYDACSQRVLTAVGINA